MVFSSIIFLFYFLLIVLAVYFAVPDKYKNLVLLLFSLIFYSWGEPIYIGLMLFSSVVDYFHAIIVDKYRGTIKSKLALISSVVINLGMLGIFKYSDFIITNINNIFGFNIGFLELALPVGISFYTFQTMSYTIDVYRGEAPVQKNFIDVATYVSLFPQLVAGPIVRYETIASELRNRKHNMDMFSEGVYRFTIGLSKKVIIANNMGIIWSEIKSMPFENISVLTSWLGILAFALQIYFDFSGYSDMAIGLGKMFGFNFCENFDYPYISKSVTEFWRRWHMSLGSWLRDYVYIPLGGNRVKTNRWLLNILIVWTLTGIWHGASWNFVIWGLYFSVILILEKFVLKNILEKVPKFLKHIYVIVLLLISWVIFEFVNTGDIARYLYIMFGGANSIADKTFYYYLQPNILMMLIAIIGSTPLVKKYILSNSIMSFIIPTVGLILSTAYLIDSSFNPFLYFRF